MTKAVYAEKKRDLSFTSIAEAFTQSIRAGESPSIDDFIRRFPQFADQIEEEFPGIEIAEQLSQKVRPSKHAKVPELLGRYRIIKELGRGGMGCVYSAFHESMKRPVAIKVLSLLGPQRRIAIRRFYREAQETGKLNHPNIVPIYDFGVQDDLMYIVMQRIRGLDLSRIIEALSKESSIHEESRIPMDWRMIAEIGSQVASAIGYAHEKGLVHRDIKPGNLLMESNGRIWVTDFGLVKVLEGDQSISRTGDLIGTPRYMSPEQLRGICDNRSDIYGLGITLYELASGRKAWEELSGNEIIVKRPTLELPPVESLNPDIPSAISDIIMKCCAFNPDERYQSANELHYVLNRYLHGHTVGERRKTRNTDRSIMNRRPILYARIAATTVGLGILGWTIVIATQKKDPFKDPIAAMSVLKDSELRSEFVKELPSLIDEVVHNNDPKFRKVIGDLTENTFVKSVDEADLPDQDKKRIKDQITDWVEQYKEGKLPALKTGKAWRSIWSPEASQSTWFDRSHLMIVHSNLTDQEKFLGHQWLFLLRRGMDEKRLSKESITKIFDTSWKITLDSNPENQEQFIQPSDEDLRRFLQLIETEVSAVGGVLPQLPEVLQSAEIKDTQQMRQQIENAIGTQLEGSEVSDFLDRVEKAIEESRTH